MKSSVVVVIAAVEDDLTWVEKWKWKVRKSGRRLLFNLVKKPELHPVCLPQSPRRCPAVSHNSLAPSVKVRSGVDPDSRHRHRELGRFRQP